MAIAKGQIQPDKSYRYTCGKCGGFGQTKEGKLCDHCYDGIYERLIEEFATARGERYYALLKAILRIKGKAIYDYAQSLIKENGGKLRPVDFGHCVLEFNFPHNRMKPIAEWLEETGLIPVGAWSRLNRRKNFTIKECIEAAQVER